MLYISTKPPSSTTFHVQSVSFPSFNAQEQQDVEIKFSGGTSLLPMYSVKTSASNLFSISRLTDIDVQVAMVCTRK